MYYKGVKVYNSSNPWKYNRGGKIHTKPDMTKAQLSPKNDSVLIIAQPKELIIPRTHPKFKKDGQLVNKVVNYLGSLGVKLPNT